MNISNECSAVAEVMFEVAPPVACAAGTYALNPEFCVPWIWLTANPGYKEMSKLAVEKGCDIFVEIGPKYYKIILRDAKSGAGKLKRQYNAINTPKGMIWLIQYLSRYGH